MECSSNFLRIMTFTVLICCVLLTIAEGQSLIDGSFGSKLISKNNPEAAFNSVINRDARQLQPAVHFEPYQEVYTIKNKAGDTQQVHYAVDDYGLRANFHSNSVSFDPSIRFGERLKSKEQDAFIPEPLSTYNAPQNNLFSSEPPRRLYDSPQTNLFSSEPSRGLYDSPQNTLLPPPTNQQVINYFPTTFAAANDAKVQENEHLRFPGPVPQSTMFNLPLADKIDNSVNINMAKDENRETEDSLPQTPSGKSRVDSRQNSPQRQKEQSVKLEPIDFSYPSAGEMALISSGNFELLRTPVIKDKYKITSLPNLPRFKPQTTRFDNSKSKTRYSITQKSTQNVVKEVPKSLPKFPASDSAVPDVKSIFNETTTETPVKTQNMNNHLINENIYQLEKAEAPVETRDSTINIFKNSKFPSIITSPLSTVFDTSSKNGQYYHYVMNLGQNVAPKSQARTRIYSTGNGLLEILNKTGISYYKNPNIPHEVKKDASELENNFDKLRSSINDSKPFHNNETELEAIGTLSDVVVDKLDSILPSMQIQNNSLEEKYHLQNLKNEIMNQLTHIIDTNGPQEDKITFLDGPVNDSSSDTLQKPVSTPSNFLGDVLVLDKNTFPVTNLTNDVWEILYQVPESENEENITTFKLTIPDKPLNFVNEIPTANTSNEYAENTKEPSQEWDIFLEDVSEIPILSVVNISTESASPLTTSSEMAETTTAELPITYHLTSIIPSTSYGTEEKEFINNQQDTTTLNTDFTTVSSKTVPTTSVTSKPMDATPKNNIVVTETLVTQSPLDVSSSTTSSTGSETEATTSLAINESSTSEPKLITDSNGKLNESVEKTMFELVIQNTEMSDLVSRLHNMPMIIRVLNPEKNMSFPVELVANGESTTESFNPDEVTLNSGMNIPILYEISKNHEKNISESENKTLNQEDVFSVNKSKNQTKEVLSPSSESKTNIEQPLLIVKNTSAQLDDNIFDESREKTEKRKVMIVKKVANKTSVISQIWNNTTDSYQSLPSSKKLTLISPSISGMRNKTVIKRTKIVKKSKKSRNNENRRITVNEPKSNDSIKDKSTSINSPEKHLQILPFEYTSPKREISATYKSSVPDEVYTSSKGLELQNKNTYKSNVPEEVYTSSKGLELLNKNTYKSNVPEKIYTSSKGLELQNKNNLHDQTVFVDHISDMLNSAGLLSEKDIQNDALKYISTVNEPKSIDSIKDKSTSINSPEKPLQILPFEYTSPKREISATYKSNVPEEVYTSSKGLELQNKNNLHDQTVFIDRISDMLNSAGLLSEKDIQNNALKYISHYPSYVQTTGIGKHDFNFEKDLEFFPVSHDDEVRHSQQLFGNLGNNNASEIKAAQNAGKFDYVDILPYDAISGTINHQTDAHSAPDAVIIIDDYEDIPAHHGDLPAHHGDDRYIFVGQNERSVTNTKDRGLFIDPSSQKVSYIDFE